MTDSFVDATTDSGRPTGGHGLPHLVAVTLSAVGGLVFGGLTQLGQTYLPDWLHSLANSGAPWVLIAFASAQLSRAMWVACLSGTLALAGLEIGYVVMAAMRNFGSASTTVTFWLTAAVVFGPLAGLAAYFVRTRQVPWGALGGGLVAGIVTGEGLASYVTIRDTTTPAYWVGQMIFGVVLLALVGRRTSFGWAVAAFTIGVAGLLATRYVPMFGA